MKSLATGGLIITLCGALLPALSAMAHQNPANKTLSAINSNGPNGLNGLIYPNGLALDDGGDLHISDIGAHRVLKLDPRGRMTVIAGTGEGGFGGDGGPATKARLFAPHDLAFDSAGDLLIADTFNHVVRRVDRDGKIATFAGTVPGHGGDGGDAKDGSLFIADRANHRVRKVDTRGAIITIAGAGKTMGMMFDPAIR